MDERTFDAKGEPTLVVGGYHRAISRYDPWGRLIEQRFFNLSDDPVEETKQIGAHWETLEYDDHGNSTSIKLFDKLNKPVVAGEKSWDFAAHELRMTFDSENRAKTVAYFDGEGKPLTGPEGWHSERIEYDDRAFVAAITFFDQTGKRVNQKTTGIYRWEFVNDASGQPVEERYFGIDGKPVARLDGGYHLRKNEYDKVGNLTTQVYFDVDDKPVANRTNGVHRYVASFDRFRHPVLTQYFDEAGQPINNQQGFHKVEYTYDDYGSKTESRWYDKEQQPTLGPDGVQVVRSTYDERGLLTRQAYYDAENRAVTDREGIHEKLISHNDKRQQTQWQVFGLNKKPVEDKDGDHLVLTEFDERGRQTMRTELRADGGPNWDRELGIATMRQDFDKEGNLLEQAFYDAENHLVTGPYGFAIKRTEQEPDGRIAVINYGVDGKPAFNPLQGFAIKKTDSRTRGDTVDSYYGPNGALVEGPEGYAEVRRHWDDDGKLLAEAFFGPDGAPVAGDGGYHRFEQSQEGKSPYFDAEGRELGPGSVESIIFIEEIYDAKQPAAKLGLQAGDILWRYGNWSYPQALATERTKGTEHSAQLGAVAEALFTENKRLSDGPVSMTVIRHGQAIQLTVPPLPNKSLGVRLTRRAVPIALFDAWKGIGPGNQAETAADKK